MDQDLKIIKKYYGEKMMHLCRELFPTMLEEKGLLSKLILDNFAPNKFLYEDIINSKNKYFFKDYIYGLLDMRKNLNEVTKTPKELLSEAGYDLYECNTEDDIQSFKKYYEAKEKLCTFNGGRLDHCYVFFAVKKNVDKIRRKDFINPERQDEYGTSVISIQFSRGTFNTLSIKNRYNHKVSNPDATFSNNLENIIEGLTESFEKYYDLNINQNICKTFELPGYVKANDGKFYKYNYEINNVYYCPNNIIINNFMPKKLDKEMYVLIDYFILDLVDKKISLYNIQVNDGFIKDLNNIKKIEIRKDKITKNKTINIILDNEKTVIIVIDKYNRMISYINEEIKEVPHNYLYYNKYLKHISLPNALKIDLNFLLRHNNEIDVDLPKVLEIKSNFLQHNKMLSNINLPNVISIGDDFLEYNHELTNIYLPHIKKIDRGFLCRNRKITEIDMPELEYVGSSFMVGNLSLKNITLPSLKYAGDYFISCNEIIECAIFTSLEKVENSFFSSNGNLKYLYMPNIIEIGDRFLRANEKLKNIDMKKLETVGEDFLRANIIIDNVNFDNLKRVAARFLHSNNALKELEIKNLEYAGSYFLYHNNSIVRLILPKLKVVGKTFLYNNKTLEEYDLSSIENYGKCFLDSNPKVKNKIIRGIYDK